MKISKMATLEIRRGEDWPLEFFIGHLHVGYRFFYISFVVCHTTPFKKAHVSGNPNQTVIESYNQIPCIPTLGCILQHVGGVLV